MPGQDRPGGSDPQRRLANGAAGEAIAQAMGEFSMSYCAIIPFHGYTADHDRMISFHNAWGGHARIWTALYDTHLLDPSRQYDSWLIAASQDPHDRRLWELVDDGRLSSAERLVHAATFDYALIARKNFRNFANQLRAFRCQYPPEPEDTCHLAAWAQAIEHADADYLGFWGTSVTRNPWEVWVDEETSRPYDLSQDHKHFDVYARYSLSYTAKHQENP